METSMGSIQKAHRAPIPPNFEPQGLQNRSQRYHPDTKRTSKDFHHTQPLISIISSNSTPKKKAKQKMQQQNQQIKPYSNVKPT